MSQKYACLNYGSCTNAGQQLSGATGVAPVCTNCGGLMVAQGRAARSGGAGRLVRVVGLGVLTIIVAVSVWKIATWAFHRTVGYDIKGQWRAESTAVLGYKLPIGVNLAFDESGAHVLDQHVKVVAYEREGNEVSVVVQPDSGPQINLVFVFEDRDHMVLAGPLGISMRYRRVKIAQ